MKKRPCDPVIELMTEAAKQAALIEQAVYRLAEKQCIMVTIRDEIEFRKDGKLLAEYHYWYDALEWLLSF